MDITTLIGFAGALTAVVATMLIEGGNPASFVNFGALILIFGGSIGIGFIQYDMKTMLGLPKLLIRTVFPPKIEYGSIISTLVLFSDKARREGLLVLEEEIGGIEDDLMKMGIQGVVDGLDIDLVRQMLSELSGSIEEEGEKSAEVFEALGGYSPTLGIIGTVMGLVHVLESLGAGGMEELGRGIAVAFIATFYGIGFANLFWMPVSGKLKRINERIVTKNEIISTGVISINEGLNPKVVLTRLLCCIKDEQERQSTERVLNEIAA